MIKNSWKKIKAKISLEKSKIFVLFWNVYSKKFISNSRESKLSSFIKFFLEKYFFIQNNQNQANNIKLTIDYK